MTVVAVFVYVCTGVAVVNSLHGRMMISLWQLYVGSW